MIKLYTIKKIFILLFVTFVVCTAAQSRPTLEFSFDYNCLTACQSEIDFTGNGLLAGARIGKIEKKVSSPAGLGASTSVFLGSPSKGLDLGVGTSVSYNTFSKCFMDGKEEKVEGGYVLSFTAGPALRYTFVTHTSLYFCPGIRFNIQDLRAEMSTLGKIHYKEKNIMVNFSCGVRQWFFSTGKTGIGIDAGADLAFPINSISTVNYTIPGGGDASESYKVTSGRLLKFYLGMCFNLGNRTTE